MVTVFLREGSSSESQEEFCFGDTVLIVEKRDAMDFDRDILRLPIIEVTLSLWLRIMLLLGDMLETPLTRDGRLEAMLAMLTRLCFFWR